MADIVVDSTLPQPVADGGAADGWEISTEIKHWKMKDKRAFSKAFGADREITDEAEIYPYFARLVKQWPFPYDPADAASYDELTVEEFGEVTEHVVAAFQSAGLVAK